MLIIDGQEVGGMKAVRLEGWLSGNILAGSQPQGGEETFKFKVEKLSDEELTKRYNELGEKSS